MYIILTSRKRKKERKNFQERKRDRKKEREKERNEERKEGRMEGKRKKEKKKEILCLYNACKCIYRKLYHLMFPFHHHCFGHHSILSVSHARSDIPSLTTLMPHDENDEDGENRPRPRTCVTWTSA